MNEYRYRGYFASGEKAIGQVNALTTKDALHQLVSMGLTVSDLQLASNTSSGHKRGNRGTRVSRRWLAHLVGQLALLCEAQVPIDRALKTIQAQQTRRYEAEVIGDIVDRLAAGQKLSQALADFGRIPPSIIAMIRAGEVSSDVVRGLRAAASQLDKENDIRTRIGSAMLYPAVLLVTACGSIAVVVTVLVPALMPLFRDNRMPPPFILAFLDRVGTFLSACFLEIGAAAIAMSILFVFAQRSNTASQAAARLRLALPGMGVVIREMSTITACRIMSALVESGVTMPETLSFAAQSISNKALRAELEGAVKAVTEGAKLSDALLQMRSWQPALATFAAIGEQTGQVPRLLSNLANITEASLRLRVDRTTSVLVPAMTIAIGLVVGWVIVSIMQAVLGINDLAIR